MPEGPEIRRAADALAQAVVDQPLQHAWFASPPLKRFQKPLEGRRIVAITPRGKALLTRFDNQLTLYTHNQLYGVWRVVDAGERPQTRRSLRVVLETSHRAILLYSASDIQMVPTDEVAQLPFLRRIGPDVLDPALTADDVFARFRDPRFARHGLGGLLLDQAFIAGLGNYLRAEILWQAQVSVNHRPADLDDGTLRALADATLDVPRRSYHTRGRRDAGSLQHTPFRFRVYQRDGKSCARCGGIIERSTVSGRPFFACPDCQR